MTWNNSPPYSECAADDGVGGPALRCAAGILTQINNLPREKSKCRSTMAIFCPQKEFNGPKVSLATHTLTTVLYHTLASRLLPHHSSRTSLASAHPRARCLLVSLRVKVEPPTREQACRLQEALPVGVRRARRVHLRPPPDDAAVRSVLEEGAIPARNGQRCAAHGILGACGCEQPPHLLLPRHWPLKAAVVPQCWEFELKDAAGRRTALMTVASQRSLAHGSSPKFFSKKPRVRWAVKFIRRNAFNQAPAHQGA